jgi:ribonuclease P protein component
MLPKKRRVGTELFPPILKGGKTTSSEHFSFRFMPVLRAQESRFSFVVSGKISKKATERNLLKRRGYAVVKKNSALEKIPIAGVFFAKNGSTKLSYAALKQEISNLFIKAHIV